jgi:DNA modification methylase
VKDYESARAQNAAEVKRRIIENLKSKYLATDVRTASPAARSIKMSEKLTPQVKQKILAVGAYLKDKLTKSGYTIKQLAEITGIKQTTLEHYFRTDFSGQMLPNREDWNLLKPLLGLGEYDEYIDEEIRQVLPQPHPIGRNPGDFWSINTKPFKEAHFATFPPELPLRPILASCPPDGVVLDPLAGSGTVAYTCELINRGMWDEFRIYVNENAKRIKWNLKWIMIEINPEYCKIAEKRLEPFMKQMSLDV